MIRCTYWLHKQQDLESTMSSTCHLMSKVLVNKIVCGKKMFVCPEFANHEKSFRMNFESVTSSQKDSSYSTIEFIETSWIEICCKLKSVAERKSFSPRLRGQGTWAQKHVKYFHLTLSYKKFYCEKFHWTISVFIKSFHTFPSSLHKNHYHIKWMKHFCSLF